MKLYILTAFLTFSLATATVAQTRHAFWEDVQTIKDYDRIYTPAAHPILFVGSSSIRKWGDLQQVFGSWNVINRGVGGTVIDDITYYLDDLVFAYKPRQIVLYVGENDLPNETETAGIVLDKTITLFKAIRAKLPDVPIIYIALKPSPVRDKYMKKCMDANLLIRNFLAKEKNTVFLDVFTLMLKDGKSRPELFQQDMLHMKPAGYAIWEKAIRPYLLKAEK
jgi:lysophospholipase L1-like esterase